MKRESIVRVSPSRSVQEVSLTSSRHYSVLAVSNIIGILQGSQDTANIFLELAAQIVIATTETNQGEINCILICSGHETATYTIPIGLVGSAYA